MMKKAFIVAAVCLSFVQISYAKTSDLPFVGTRYFNMAGGNCTEESITIKKNGEVSLKYHGCQGTATYFKGKFSNPLKIQEKNETYYYQIKDNQIYELDENKQVSNKCTIIGREDSLCISQLIE